MKQVIFSVVFFTTLILNAQKKHFETLSPETIGYYKQGKYCWDHTEDSCIPYYKKMLVSARSKKECVPCAEIELARGYYYEGAMDSAIYHARNVFSEAKKQKSRLRLELEQDTYNLMCGIYSAKGDNSKAISYLLESGKRAEQLENKEQINIVKGNLGVLYITVGNTDRGIKFQKEALKGFQDLGITKNIANFAGNIASAYIDKGMPDSARYWARYTLKYATREKDINNIIAGNYLIASSYEIRNPDSALAYVDKAISLSQSKQHTNLLATAYNIKGNILLSKSNYPEAKKYYLKSIEINRSIGKPAGLHAPLKTLGLEAHLHKDYETASKYLTEYIAHMDSVASEENRNMVHEYSEKYESEKKEKQIVEQALKIEKQKATQLYSILGGVIVLLLFVGIFLQYRKFQQMKLAQFRQERESAILNSFIEGEEAERKRISYELHDGVAAMIGAAKLSLDTLPHLPENEQKIQLEKVKIMLENTHNDVRHIAHNLLPHLLKSEGLVKATELFAHEINESKLINITVIDENSNPERLPHQLQLLLFRVVQELINNILKHSQAHHAVIAFSRDSELLKIKIADDGIGYDGKIDATSHGLSSIVQRMNSIGGTFHISKSDDQGTIAIVTIRDFEV